MATGINAYDTDISAEVQAEINRICQQLMAILTGHTTDVNTFWGEFEATEVSELYSDVESRLGSSGTAVVEIIQLVQRTLNLNDETALQTHAKVRGVISAIG